MREKACENKTALRVLYSGGCIVDPPTPLRLLTSWPSSLDNLPSDTQEFIEYAVIFLVVSISNDLSSAYTPAYFADKLSDVLGYQAVIPKITRSHGGQEMMLLNVTIYALYHSSLNGSEVGSEVIVPNTELLRTVQDNHIKLEQKVNVQFVSAAFSVTSTATTMKTTSQPMNGGLRSIIIAVCSVFGVVALVVLIIVYLLYRRFRGTASVADEKEAVVNLPGKDALTVESGTINNLGISKVI
jgi:hypothetical protein